MPDQILVTDENGVRTIRMNRPEKKNALTQPMYAEMTRALRDAEGSDTIRCVIFAGSPGAFCAGSDISDFQKRAEGGLKPVTVDFLHALVRNPKPLLAAVDGLAIGIGTTMLLHCDYVVAASGTTFATPFTKLGLIPEAASSLLGPMRMGHARAFALLVMGRSMMAEEAKAVGLVNTIVDPAALDSAVMQARKLMRGNLDDIVQRVDTEAMYFRERLQSDEARTAFAAFLARKK